MNLQAPQTCFTMGCRLIFLNLSSFLLVSSASAIDRPNFVYFFPDTLRAESCGGLYSPSLKPLNLTPNLDALARQGSTFRQCHAMHTQCSASRCTMLTGRYMHVLGHRTQFHLLQAYEENYFRLLKESGYHVYFLGKNDVFSAASFNLSVNEWDMSIGHDSGNNAYEFGEAGYYSFLYQGGRAWYDDATENGDTLAVRKAAEFLHNNPPEPFVLFLATRGAHPPYGAPKGYHNNLKIEDVKRAVKLRQINTTEKPEYHAGIRKYRNLTTLSQDVYYQIHKSYLEMIQYTDWTLGVVMEALMADQELNNRTVVAMSSDHGDFAGDYGLVEKWPGAADDILTRVPLVMRIPDGKQGHIVEDPVQTADILETMLELANVTSHYVRFAQSLVPALKGGLVDENRFVYSEGGFAFESEMFPGGSDHTPDNPRNLYWPRAQQEMEEGSPKWVMIRNATTKLVYRPLADSELYQLEQDPLELKNRWNDPAYASLQVDLMTHLTTWLVQTGDVPPLRRDSRRPPRRPNLLTWKSCEELMEPDQQHETRVILGELAMNGIPAY